MSKHTEGPWTTNTDTHCWGHCGFEIRKGRRALPIAIVGLAYQTTDENEHQTAHNPRNAEQAANAHLITAAPELLEAAEFVLQQFTPEHLDSVSGTRCGTQLKAAVTKAKAEG